MRKNILFDHNQKAYQAAVSMMEETGKAAVIHPTGTGKSFIGFQLCADHKKERVCWLSPSEYIYKTQREKWLLAGGEEMVNLCFMTYAKLMRLGEEELAKLNPNYLILDEFHRLGAAQWGRGVEVLREKYPRMKILGLSATNIRYLDNQRDMAWELFGGNVASELTLGAAIAQGILPAPKYVLSVYSYQKELYRYQARVGQVKNKAVRDRAEKELEALRRALEKAEGLTEVFAKHMGARTEKVAEHREFKVKQEKTAKYKQEERKEKVAKVVSGKYIVFCANYEHLLEMRELAPEWFAKVDANPHIYTAYSDDPMTATEFEAFKRDESDHLKLLYCIDMLNEGIHVDGLSGVILLRPTVSPTIYKQQIGRALAAGGKEIPVIFDIVMNIENLCSIGAVEEELRQAVFFCRANGRAEDIVRENFQIVDELGDCRKLFAQLNETLGASWDAMYTMAKEYYETYGNLEIPAKYATAEGYSLGAWISTQRKVYLGKTAGCLSKEQIERLTKIGMRWQSESEAAWEKNFAEAEKYFKEHGNLEVPADFVTENGCGLGRWIRRQREQYQSKNNQNNQGVNDPELVNSKLSMELEKSLEMEEENNKREESKKESNKKESDKREEDKKESRKKFSQIRKNAVEEEHIRRLTGIGMIWENMDSWERRFALAEKYYKEHGNLRMPSNYVVEGVWLERWLREQRAKLDEEVEENVEKNFHEERSLNQERMLNEEKMLNKEKILNQEKNSNKEKELNKKKNLNEEKKHYRPLKEEQKQKLASIGVVAGMSQAERSWREQYGEAEEFYRQYGNLAVPKRYVAGNGKNLGIWLQHQRANHRSGKLASWQIRMLDGIGMVWEAADSWEQGLAHAKKYFLANGHLLVPYHYVCPDGYRLGKWISNQRLAYGGATKKRLEEDRIQQLEAFGMIWNAGQGKRPGKVK